MKTIALFLLPFISAIAAKPGVLIRSETTYSDPAIDQQLASLLVCPPVIAEKNKGGTVVVQFYLTNGISIGRVKVFSGNQHLNDDLTRQLTGKKLQQIDYRPEQVYTVRLHFKPGF